LNVLLAALVCIALVEVALRLPLGDVIQAILSAVARSLKTVGAARVSDHWKEKAMAAYARQTFEATARLALLLGALLGVATALVWAFDRFRPGFLAFLLGWAGIGFTLIFATAWYFARQRLFGAKEAVPAGTASNYSAGDRLLHALALDNAALAKTAFRLDQGRVSRPVEAILGQRHVFVSGLARAGTTVLMRRLHASGRFRSLTYRDMPFVMAPNLWGALTGVSRKDLAAAERAHGDRLQVDADSPESLDEIHWRLFDGEHYIRANALVLHAPAPEVVEGYRAQVNAILWATKPAATRYLSKNNNNILRLAAIRQAFPQALILVPFREPKAHAGSLLRMHRTFIDQQRADPFVKSYMGWLGHHEFGLDHRPFRFGAEPATGDPGTLAYWLDRWIDAYTHIEATLPAGTMLVCYEDLCRDPGVWETIAVAADVPVESPAYEPFIAGRDDGGEAVRADEARALYARLREQANVRERV
jgi:hypothetical protein